ncbi:hypothetical protein A2363_01695 [Candidatus Gottesmanbacteria bacterium RIFOXYB1_FULL_47_11]|uniref:DUF7489 domain-containing protein n=1 Tax=Candidatus Gottesmanbacteria bacterium RIFOXYB1_FULL_47_11 TaxID=1798401 RepID=A0A1F6BDB5_9BACT|nr:MAG: hypothetical protein A2363_01695 [Candidatus Gottesmanbacteria bacterium RIFOXYB1_FULL_47_11]
MKGCVFGIMLIFLVPIILAAVFIAKIFMKGKAEGWKGKVIDKSHNSKRGSFEDSKKIEHFYSLKVKMEDGKERNIAVSSQFYGECSVGDIIEKPKGAIFPKKAGK